MSPCRGRFPMPRWRKPCPCRSIRPVGRAGHFTVILVGTRAPAPSFASPAAPGWKESGLRNPDETREPRVFVSHAWADELAATRFVADVERHGPGLFLDRRDIPPGANVVAEINKQLEESDYFVLLWSSTAKDREWVRREWYSAVATEVRKQRAFLFIVRLDDTELPALL